MTFLMEEWLWWWDLLPIPFLLWIFSSWHSCTWKFSVLLFQPCCRFHTTNHTRNSQSLSQSLNTQLSCPVDRNFSLWLWTVRTLSFFPFMRIITLIQVSFRHSRVWYNHCKEHLEKQLRYPEVPDCLGSNLILQVTLLPSWVFSISALPTWLQDRAVPCLHRQYNSLLVDPG